MRKAGARIRLISDGDVSAAIATCKDDTGIDILFGIGGAPEGVLAAAALRCVGGDMQGRLQVPQRRRARARREDGRQGPRQHLPDRRAGAGRRDVRRHRRHRRRFLEGVHFFGGGATTHIVVMRCKSGTVRFIDATHHFDRKPA